MRINKSLITYIPSSGSGSGTVTSVALSAPTGFVVTGSPITSSGTLALAFASGYSLPTTIKQSNWDDAYTWVTNFPVGTEGQLVKFDAFGDLEAFTPNFITNPMTSLGDMIRGNAVGLPIRLAGNTTTTKMYLSQTGDGTNSDTPIWSAISVGEVSGAVSALTGEVSTTGSGSLNVTLGTTAVTGKLLTGLSVTSGAITSSDSILSAFGKVQGQINGLAGGSTYKGSWNASTNTPTIVSGTGTTGDYYIVSTAGSTTIDGVSSWDIGDWIIFSGTVWQKIDNTDSVISVNGQVGAVTLTTTDITEGTRLYYTDARARAAISLTTTGASGAATYSSGVLNIPNYTLSGLGGISGSGTTNYIPKFTGTTSLGDSLIYDNGTNVGIGRTPSYKLDVNGDTRTFGYLIGVDNAAAIKYLLTNDGGNSYINSGNVGIGSINPNAKLNVVSTGAKSTISIGDTASGTYSQLLMYGGATKYNWSIGAQYNVNNSLEITPSTAIEGTTFSTPVVSILHIGNVGIGTDSPTEKLHVVGNGYFNSSGTTVLTTNSSNSTGNTALQINALGSAKGLIGFGTYLTTDGGVAIRTAASTPFSIAIGGSTPTLTVATTGQIKFSQYTSVSSFSGTIAGLLAFDSSGNVITTSLAGVGGVPTSRTITINGTTQDLSANRTYSVGTVTSVNASVPTGFAVGSAVTSSGNIAISFAAGYALPTTASQTTWDAAYNDKINSASVTGTTTKTLTLNQQDGGTITASWTDINTDAVTSVFGRTGAVVAASGDYNTSQVTENVANLYYTEARVSANTDVAANTAARHNAVTLGTANGLSLSTQQLSLGLASGSTNGALSSTDWTTFNNKQSTLTNPVTGNGAGAIGYFPIFSGVNSIENSSFFQSGTGLYFGGGSASEYSLQIGHGRSGNGFAYIDLIGDTTYTDYGMRFIRSNGGANTTSSIEHRGTGDFIFKGVDASTIKFQTGSTDRIIVDSAGRVGIGVSPSYTLQVNGSGYFSDNVRFPNTKGLLFENTSNTAIGSINVISFNNSLQISHSGTSSLNLLSDSVYTSDNFGIGQGGNVFGSGSRTISIPNGTAPSSSVSSSFLMYSANIVSGNAAPHFRTENGAVIKLYQETTAVGNAIFSAGGGNSVLDDSTFDGYTLRQIVKALRNQGILA